MYARQIELQNICALHKFAQATAFTLCGTDSRKPKDIFKNNK